MKLNREQYTELTEKLASELVENMYTTEGASVADDMMQEKMAGYAYEDDYTDEEIEVMANEVYDRALAKMAAAQSFYEDGAAQEQACIESLAEAGLYDEYGLDKEAAESSEEAIDFTNRVAEYYEDAQEKMASAEEVYAEASDELMASAQILSEFGYTFE